MKIGGFIKNSLIDYPGKIAAVVFTQGCNMQCRYCHNPELVLPEMIKEAGSIPEEQVFDYLEKNKQMLDAVVVTGGEPTLQGDLIDFIIKVKSYGLLVKLDTNGSAPETLKELIDLKLIDYIAMDVKAPLELKKYQEIAGDIVNYEMLDKIKNSIWRIIKSGLPHEFRTTTVKHLITKDDIERICESIKGCQTYCLQDFNPEIVLEDSFKQHSGYSTDVLKWISGGLNEYSEVVKVR